MKIQMLEPNHIRYTPRDGFCSRNVLDIRHDNPERFEYCWSGSGNVGDLRFIKTEIRPGFDIWMSVCRIANYDNFSGKNGVTLFPVSG